MKKTTPKSKPEADKIDVESGFEKRLGEMYKKVLHTPPKHVPDKRTQKIKSK